MISKSSEQIKTAIYERGLHLMSGECLKQEERDTSTTTHSSAIPELFENPIRNSS